MGYRLETTHKMVKIGPSSSPWEAEKGKGRRCALLWPSWWCVLVVALPKKRLIGLSIYDDFPKIWKPTSFIFSHLFFTVFPALRFLVSQFNAAGTSPCPTPVTPETTLLKTVPKTSEAPAQASCWQTLGKRQLGDPPVVITYSHCYAKTAMLLMMVVVGMMMTMLTMMTNRRNMNDNDDDTTIVSVTPSSHLRAHGSRSSLLYVKLSAWCLY